MYEVAPPGIRTVNKQSRFADHLAGLWIPQRANAHELITGQWPTTSSGQKRIESTPCGPGLRYVKANSDIDHYRSNNGGASVPFSPVMSSASLFLLATFPVLAGAGVHAFGPGTLSSQGINFRPSSANAMRGTVDSSGGVTTITGSTIVANALLSYLLTWDGTTVTLYEQGQVKTTGAASGTITVADAQSLAIGSDGASPCDLILVVGAIWPNRCLVARDAVELYQKPFSSFLMPLKKYYFWKSTGNAFTQTLSATTTPTATITRQTGKIQTATTTPNATIVRQTKKPVSATTTPVATIVRQTNKPVSANTTPNATIVRSTAKALFASTTPNAAIVRQTNKPLSINTTPVATIIDQASNPITLSASTTPVATITATFIPANTNPLPPHRGVLIVGKPHHRNE